MVSRSNMSCTGSPAARTRWRAESRATWYPSAWPRDPTGHRRAHTRRPGSSVCARGGGWGHQRQKERAAEEMTGAARRRNLTQRPVGPDLPAGNARASAAAPVRSAQVRAHPFGGLGRPPCQSLDDLADRRRAYSVVGVGLRLASQHPTDHVRAETAALQEARLASTLGEVRRQGAEATHPNRLARRILSRPAPLSADVGRSTGYAARLQFLFQARIAITRGRVRTTASA